MATHDILWENLRGWSRVPSLAHAPPIILWNMRISTYGISYDLEVRKIDKPLPNGYGISNANIYHQLATYLVRNGYGHQQYSVYGGRSTLLRTFATMTQLRIAVLPPGIIPSVLRKMQIYEIPHQSLVFDHQMSLGGAYNADLIYPTPSHLAAPPGPNAPFHLGTRISNLPGPQQWGELIGQPGRYVRGSWIPHFVRDVESSWDADNWRIPNTNDPPLEH